MFSWDNQRLHRHNPGNVNFDVFGTRVLRRLDRIYCSDMNHSRMKITSCILPGFAFSDHAPVVATLALVASQKRTSRFRMNVAHLSCPEMTERIENLWEIKRGEADAQGWDTETLFSKCLKGTRAIDRSWGKRRAIERRARLMLLQSRLCDSRVALENQPDDPLLQNEVLDSS